MKNKKFIVFYYHKSDIVMSEVKEKVVYTVSKANIRRNWAKLIGSSDYRVRNIHNEKEAEISNIGKP